MGVKLALCVLDDVDRMYKATNTSLYQDQATFKESDIRTLESAVLQKELLLAKQKSENLNCVVMLRRVIVFQSTDV